MIVRAPTALCSSFAPRVATRRASTRAAGSSRWVGSGTNIDETLFALSMSSLPSRIDTGHEARSGRSGSPSMLSRYERNAPVAVASTTSFTVQSSATLIAFTSSSETDAIPTRRCGVNGALKTVRGAVSGTPPVGRSGSRRICATFTMLRTSFGVACAMASATGRRSRDSSACRTSSKSDGRCSGSQSSIGGGATGSGSRSRMLVARLAPDTPSIVAWCMRANRATAPFSIPSMIQNSQSGRDRSSCRPAMPPMTSISWSIRPGSGTAM